MKFVLYEQAPTRVQEGTAWEQCQKKKAVNVVMRISSYFLFFIFFFLVDVYAESNINRDNGALTRFDFPSEFVFGAGTSAYQVEGAAAEDGRKPSVWDTYTHREENIDQGTGDITSDQYHRYKDDVKLMYNMGLDAYRFSISWSRLIPDGRGAVNPKGLQYYNNLIDELISHGIGAHVTLSHFDIPQALQDEYEGFLSPKFIEDFNAYADVCFKEFGDRVKYWMTFNEPNTQFGFTRCFSPLDHKCSNGDSKKEVYLPAHNILLSHASAVHLYRTKYQEKQKGQIGMTLLGIWFEPRSNSPLDINAAKSDNAFLLEWFLEPLVNGRYPAIMRKSSGSELPYFTEKEARHIKGSFDFIGLNHYFGIYVENDHNKSMGISSNTPGAVALAALDKMQGAADYAWLDPNQFLVPGLALKKLLDYVRLKYKNPVVFIHENGFPTTGDDSANPAAQNDTLRILYLEKHVQSLLQSTREGSTVKGYFVWSLLDCFELFGSYKFRFGLYGVDFNDKDRRRYATESARWYSTLLAKTRRNQEERGTS